MTMHDAGFTIGHSLKDEVGILRPAAWLGHRVSRIAQRRRRVTVGSPGGEREA